MFNNKKSITSISLALTLAIGIVNIPGIKTLADTRPMLRGAASTSVKLEATNDFTNADKLITVSLRDSDVKQALRMFADKAGMNIIFHTEVKGFVTLDLVNVPLGEAIKMVTQMSELSYVVNSDTVMIIPSKNARKLDVSKKAMNVLPVKYLPATNVANFLNANVFRKNLPGLSNSSVATAIPSSNEVVLFGTENDFKVAQKILNKIDIKPQIATYKVNHTTPKEMATMICDALFVKDATTADGKSSVSAEWTPEMQLGGAYKVCGVKQQNMQKVTKVETLQEGEMYHIEDVYLTVSYLPATGYVQIVGGSPEQIQLVSDFIAHNDRKPPQAYVELSVVELNETGSKEFSNTWNIYSHFFTGSVGGNGLQTADAYPFFWKYNANTSNILTDFPGYFRGVVLENPSSASEALAKIFQYDQEIKHWEEGNRFNGGSYLWRDENPRPEYPEIKIESISQSFRYGFSPAISQNINFIVSSGNGRVLSNPKIVVTNGKKSTIDMKSGYLKSVDSQVLQNAGSLVGATQKTYKIEEKNGPGFKIEIVPFISPDGYVSLNIKPEYSTVADRIRNYNPESREYELVATLLQQRNLELSNIRVKDGETLVIGGLVQESETKSVSKTPILGDLPVVGVLFRNSSKNNSKQELVIMITPHIIKDNEDVAGINGTTTNL